MDYHAVIAMHDRLARQQIDDQLHFITNRDPAIAYTSENTVYARDPLQPISNTLDRLMVTPTIPLSNSVDVSSGAFYSRGILYVFHGRNSGPMPFPHPHFSHILIALKVDTRTGDTQLYVGEEYGDLPVFHPDTLPLAIVRVHPGQDVVRSEDIIDLRPWFNFDLSHPHDRVVYEVRCLAPSESVSFDRRPYHSGPPLMAVYQRLSQLEDGFRVSQNFDSLEMAAPIHNGHLLEFNEVGNGVSLKSSIRRLPIEFGDQANILFVSAQFGTPSGDGSKRNPFMTLDMAAARYNADPVFDTIFISPGVYVVQDRLEFTRDVLIIGHSADEAIIRVFPGAEGIFCSGRFEMRTICLYAQMQYDVDTAHITCDDPRLVNCIVVNNQRTEITAIFRTTVDLRFTNCIFDNPRDNFSALLHHIGEQPPGFRHMQNSIILGYWEPMFQTATNWFGVQPGVLDLLNLENISALRYRPMLPSAARNAGNFDWVGANMNGTAPDIGIYGGSMAALADVEVVPTNIPVVFRHSIQTLFSPVIRGFEHASIGAHIPPFTHIYGAVSFDGGHKWLAWREGIAAWVTIDIRRIHEMGNTHSELLTRLVEMGEIKTKGEIVVAWGMISHESTAKPFLRVAQFHCIVSPDALRKYPMVNLDILVDEFAVLVRNNTERRIEGLVFVCY